MWVFHSFNAVQNNTSLKHGDVKGRSGERFNAVQNNTSLKQCIGCINDC